MPRAVHRTRRHVSNFYYISGRRYRLFVEINAGIASASARQRYFGLHVDGTAQAGGVSLQSTARPGMHQHFSYEFYLEKYGMSAGLHNMYVTSPSTVGQITHVQRHGHRGDA